MKGGAIMTGAESLEFIVESTGSIDFRSNTRTFFDFVFSDAVQMGSEFPTEIEFQVQENEFWIICMGQVMVCHHEINIHDVAKQIDSIFPNLVQKCTNKQTCFENCSIEGNVITVHFNQALRIA